MFFLTQASQLSERYREETTTSRDLTAKLKRIACQVHDNFLFLLTIQQKY